MVGNSVNQSQNPVFTAFNLQEVSGNIAFELPCILLLTHCLPLGRDVNGFKDNPALFRVDQVENLSQA